MADEQQNQFQQEKALNFFWFKNLIKVKNGKIKMLIKKLKDLYFQNIFSLDLFLSEIVYKNRSGFKLSKEGFRRWNRNREKFRKDKKPIGSIAFRAREADFSNTSRKFFPLDYHFFHVENQSVLKSVVEKYSQVINSPQHTFIYDENNQICSIEKGKFLMLKNIVNSIPEVLELLDQSVIDILYRYYGCHFLISHIAAYRTSYLPMNEDSKEVYAYKLHYDRHLSDTLKFFVNLSDVTVEDGPLNFFDSKYSMKILKKGYKERDDYGDAKSLIENQDQLVQLIGKPGTAAIVNTTRCLHRAGIPSLGKTRDLLIFSFESSDNSLDLFSKETKNLISQKIGFEYNMVK